MVTLSCDYLYRVHNICYYELFVFKYSLIELYDIINKESDDNMFEEIKKMPKVELHVHLDGSISKEIASKLSELSESEGMNKMVAPDKCENLSDYLTKFDFPISLMQTKENLKEIASDLVKELEKDSVIYAEIRFAPMFHTKEGLTFEEVVEAVLEGLKTNNKVKTNLILCMMRGMAKDDNLKTIEVAHKYLNKGVCAIDLAGAEDKYPLANYLELFDIANSKNIPFTIHAGENGPASEVEKAILVGARRIGHGIHAIYDKAVLNLIKERDVLLEICPTSNIQTNAINSYLEHPIKELYEDEIPLGVNTDNRTVSNISLSEEYLKLYNTFNFTLNDFQKMNENSIKHAFLNEDMKNELMEILKEQ